MTLRALSDERFLGQASSAMAANKPLQFCSGQTARLTWQKRPGRFSSRFAVASSSASTVDRCGCAA